MITLRRAVWMAALLLGAGAVPGTAQVRSGPPTEARMRLERQVRDRFEAMIRTELGIDEATAGTLRATMDAFMAPRRELAARRADLNRRLRSSGSLLDEAEARTVLTDLVAVQRAEVDLLAEEQDALLEILTPPQLVRFYTLRDQFSERVRDLRGGPPGAPRRGGGGPFPGLD